MAISNRTKNPPAKEVVTSVFETTPPTNSAEGRAKLVTEFFSNLITPSSQKVGLLVLVAVLYEQTVQQHQANYPKPLFRND